MSKILVLGRTMDMGGTEVAMAALLQKLVEKKEDVTLLLVEKRGVLLERIPKEVEVRQMIWDKKPHPALERIVGKRETPAERSFYARGMGVFLMRVVYGKKRYGKLYERILECVEPETKQYDLVFDFFGFGAFTTAFVTDRGGITHFGKHLFQFVKYFAAPTQALFKRLCTIRHYHKFLYIDVVICVCTAV